jgi:hypothetical protein
MAAAYLQQRMSAHYWPHYTFEACNPELGKQQGRDREATTFCWTNTPQGAKISGRTLDMKMAMVMARTADQMTAFRGPRTVYRKQVGEGNEARKELDPLRRKEEWMLGAYQLLTNMTEPNVVPVGTKTIASHIARTAKMQEAHLKETQTKHDIVAEIQAVQRRETEVEPGTAGDRDRRRRREEGTKTFVCLYVDDALFGSRNEAQQITVAARMQVASAIDDALWSYSKLQLGSTGQAVTVLGVEQKAAAAVDNGDEEEVGGTKPKPPKMSKEQRRREKKKTAGKTMDFSKNKVTLPKEKVVVKYAVPRRAQTMFREVVRQRWEPHRLLQQQVRGMLISLATVFGEA